MANPRMLDNGTWIWIEDYLDIIGTGNPPPTDEEKLKIEASWQKIREIAAKHPVKYYLHGIRDGKQVIIDSDTGEIAPPEVVAELLCKGMK